MKHSRHRSRPEHEQGLQRFADSREMLPHRRFFSLHAPATSAIALYGALTSGHLLAAGLDVFRTEPDYDFRFRDPTNVIMSPHIGSGSVETRNVMGFCAWTISLRCSPGGSR